ncbi:hypothetical protein BJ170DRAFT_693499 [Xylariales sp. AK1849]|nr:hypothetical protein BJ170DRAFT_693499 [Xylariales sp. AK1849]
MDTAKPSCRSAHSGFSHVTWDDKFIEELKRGLYACCVFVPQSIAWLCYLQATNKLVSQAGSVETHGLPNDSLYNLELLIGIKGRVNTGPIRRITAGFLAGTLAIAWAAIVQKLVYSAGPLRCATRMS